MCALSHVAGDTGDCRVGGQQQLRQRLAPLNARQATLSVDLQSEGAHRRELPGCIHAVLQGS